MFTHDFGTPKHEKGITGLETAIILIAFVVVASVFAFTVLSTGIFASERSKETVFAGLEEAKLKNSITALGVTRLEFALILGVSRGTLYRWVRDGNPAVQDRLDAIGRRRKRSGGSR